MDRIRFQTFADRDPSRAAVIDASGRHWSRGELARLVNRSSRAMLDTGLAEGDVLAIVAPNCAEYLTTYLAATQIGLYVVPVNWHLSAPEIAYVLTDSAAKAVVAHERIGRLISACLTQTKPRPSILLAIGEIEGFQKLSSVATNYSDAPLPQSSTGRVLSYTSATTGRPKGVKLPLASAERVLDQAISLRLASGTQTEAHICLCASMLYHGASLETTYLALHMGNTVILPDAAAPLEVLRLIHEHRATIAFMVPSTFARLLRLPVEQRRLYSQSSLRKVLHTGAPCPPDIKRQMIDWWGPIFWEAYAGVEGGGTLAASEDWLRFPGTVGRAIPGTRIKILDDSGQELPPGQPGTIYMTRFSEDRFEYVGDSDKTASAYMGDFFTLGDMGYLNEEGYLFLAGRKSDMIISFGMNIYPAEVEQVLLQYRGILDCAVFGIPDEIAGEMVMAVVQIDNPGSGNRVLTAELQGFLSRHLSLAKLPKRIAFTDESLREHTGKLRRSLLRSRYFASA